MCLLLCEGTAYCSTRVCMQITMTLHPLLKGIIRYCSTKPDCFDRAAQWRRKRGFLRPTTGDGTKYSLKITRLVISHATFSELRELRRPRGVLQHERWVLTRTLRSLTSLGSKKVDPSHSFGLQDLESLLTSFCDLGPVDP